MRVKHIPFSILGAAGLDGPLARANFFEGVDEGVNLKAGCIFFACLFSIVDGFLKELVNKMLILHFGELNGYDNGNEMDGPFVPDGFLLLHGKCPVPA